MVRKVWEATAKHLSPVVLELGGKTHCIVDRDVDVEVAARPIAWGKTVNAGQTCVTPDYLLAATFLRHAPRGRSSFRSDGAFR